MKKYIMLLLVMGITLFMPISAKAEIVFQQYDSDIETLNSIKDDAERLISDANAMIGSNYEVNDIKFEDAIKVYIDIDLFKNEQISNDILEKSISNAESVWFLPIYDKDKTVGLTISKGLPVNDDVRDSLTKEEIEQLEAEVGRWLVPEVTIDDMNKPYKELIKEAFEQNQINDGKVYILGGTLNCRQPIAINYSENRGCKIIELADIKNNSLSPQSLKDSEGVINSYEQMRYLASQNKLKDGEVGSFGIDSEKKNSKYFIILIIIIPLLGFGFMKYYKGVKKKEVK